MLSEDRKIFYRMELVPDEIGLIVVTTKYVSIHETHCFHFCVPERSVETINMHKRRDETILQSLKRRKLLKRVAKGGSRIAFDTKEKAMNNLRYLKERQLMHLKREMAFVEAFLKSDSLEDTFSDEWKKVPDSDELVHQHLNFGF